MLNKNKLFVFFLFIIVISFDNSFSQQSVDSSIISLENIFSTNFNQLSVKKDIKLDNKFLSFLDEFQRDYNVNSNLKVDLLRAKQEVYKSDLGLNLRTNYLDNQFSNVFDLEDNVSFKRRLLTSLEIDLLNSGLIENRIKAKALDYEIQYENFKLQTQTDNELYLKRFNQTIVVFNDYKIDIINRRKSMLDQLYTIEQDLYFKKRINKDELLEVQLRNAEILGLFQVYGSYNELSNLNSNSFSNSSGDIPLFDINYDVLLSGFNNLKLDSIRQILMDESEVLNQWYTNIGLSFFARHNFFQVLNQDLIVDRSFLSVGANLTIPLNFNNDKRNNLKVVEVKSKINELEQQRLIYEESLLNDLYEFRYKLKQYIAFHYKQENVKEQLRIEEVKRKLNSPYFSPIKAIKLLDDYLQIETELIDLKQNLYLKLIRIQQKVPSISISELAKPFDIRVNQKDQQKISKSIYVWSSVFDDFSNDFLSEYLVYNNFSKVIVGVNNNDVNTSKKEDLINRLVEKGHKVSLMVSNNNLISEKNISEWCSQLILKYDLSKIDALHLDVEPHTFSNWSTDKEKLLISYLEMLNQVKAFCDDKGLKLEVSLPLHYPSDVMVEIFSKVDKVYFMCYENVDENYLACKLSPFSELKSKYNIALRTEDFSDREKMEEYIEFYSKKYADYNFTYHDLRRILLFDEQEYKK